MRIRNRLLILLLAMALIPLLVSTLIYQMSMRRMSQRLTEHTKSSLDQHARETLQALLASNTETFQRDGHLVESAIKRQVLEVEKRLAAPPTHNEQVWSHTSYGIDANLLDLNSIPKGSPRHLNFQQQGFLLARNTQLADVQDDLSRLESMTAVYHDLYNNSAPGILWLYTSLANGLHTNYPLGPQRLDPNTYFPHQRPWYRDTIAANEITRHVLIDASTGEMIVTAAAPIHNTEGSPIGVTAMDRTIHDMLQDFALPAHWNIGTEKMIVDVNLSAHPRLNIIIKENDERAKHNWTGPLPTKILHSEDPNQLQSVIADLTTGQSGAQRLRYRQQDCLWVYRPLGLYNLAVVLIIPYEHIHAQALKDERTMEAESLFWLELTGIGLLGAIVMAVFLALTRSHQVTQPIRELTAAAHELATGNFDVQVNIQTGDELQRLGEVFNQTGPVLQERQAMKESLELAGAIQQNLLPQEAPQLEGFEIAGRCLYCDETGGDYYDFVTLEPDYPHTLGLALGDVTGHGIGAALMMAAVKTVLHAESRHCQDNLVALFNAMNNQLVRDTEEDKFVTFFYGLLNSDTRQLTWASAGHDPALLLHANKEKIEELPNTGMLMGLLEDVSFAQAGPVTLETGDILIVGTDGIWEAQNPEGEYYGKERLFELMHSAKTQNAQSLCETILHEVTEFIATGTRMDDITLIAVKAT